MMSNDQIGVLRKGKGGIDGGILFKGCVISCWKGWDRMGGIECEGWEGGGQGGVRCVNRET
jgi:hypothetical protein